MTELEKIAYAQSFIDKLAKGINPLDDTPIADEDIVNNIRIARCLFFVSEILDKVSEAGGIQDDKEKTAKNNKNRPELSLTAEEIERIPISEIPVTVYEIASHIKAIADEKGMKKVSGADINRWLISVGMLQYSQTDSGKRFKSITESGRELGLIDQSFKGAYGNYHKVFCDANAQRLIIDNLETIIKENKRGKENRGRPWSEEDNALLRELYDKGTPIAEMSKVLKRTQRGVYMHMTFLGFFDYKEENIVE